MSSKNQLLPPTLTLPREGGGDSFLDWPTLSVVIPAYNHEYFVTETVESFWSQGYPDLEIIAVNDLSTDGTGAVLDALAARSPCPMRVIHHVQNMGVSQTCKQGAALATGDLLLFMASDDKLVPGSLHAMVQPFLENSRLQACFGNGYQFDIKGVEDTCFYREGDKALISEPPQEILAYLQTHVCPFFIQSTLLKTDFYRAIGGHDPDCVIDDWVLHLRMFAHLTDRDQFLFNDIPFCMRRLHADNIHKNRARHWAGIEEVYQHYTPESLRKQVLSGLCWDYAKQALFQFHNRNLAWRYLWKAQTYQFKPMEAFRFIKKNRRLLK